LNRQTEEEIRKIEQDFLRNKESVIDMLLNRIIEVKLEIPEVMKGNFE
jgi:V-type H+-transporting ATPase subunit G